MHLWVLLAWCAGQGYSQGRRRTLFLSCLPVMPSVHCIRRLRLTADRLLRAADAKSQVMASSNSSSPEALYTAQRASLVSSSTQWALELFFSPSLDLGNVLFNSRYARLHDQDHFWEIPIRGVFSLSAIKTSIRVTIANCSNGSLGASIHDGTSAILLQQLLQKPQTLFITTTAGFILNKSSFFPLLETSATIPVTRTNQSKQEAPNTDTHTYTLTLTNI